MRVSTCIHRASTNAGAKLSNKQGRTHFSTASIMSCSQFSSYTVPDATYLDHALPFSDMPGPGGLKKLPYIGPLFLFQPFSRYKPETYGALVNSLHDKYGPVFRTRLGKGYTVHTSCVEDIQTIFKQEPAHPLRRLNVLNRVYRERSGLPQGLGTSNGPEWYALRKSLNVPLNRPKACMEYLPAQNKVTDDLVEQLLQAQENGQGEKTAQTIFDLLFRYSAESVAVVCFNERLGFLTNGDNHPEINHFLDAIYTHLNSSFKAMIGVERKFLRTENDAFYQNYAKAMAVIREQSTKYARRTLDSRQQTHSDIPISDHAEHGKSQNMLSTLSKIPELHMEHILAIIESLLIAGTDSTARNISVLFYHLAKHPDVQTKLAEEIINVLGPDGNVIPQSLPEMHFLKACVKESMRLYPPISPGPERMLSQDTVLSGYLVPEGTSVIMASVKTSRDPHFFPDPHSFRPERWMRVDGKKTPIIEGSTTSSAAGECSRLARAAVDPRLAALSYLPFGHGKRSCVGRRFAELEIYVCAARVLQKLRVSIDSNYRLEAIYTPFVTPVKPVPFIFTKR